MEFVSKHVWRSLLARSIGDFYQGREEKGKKKKKEIILLSVLYPLMDEMEWYGFVPRELEVQGLSERNNTRTRNCATGRSAHLTNVPLRKPWPLRLCVSTRQDGC